jgi:hypothetical protein
VDAKLNDNQMCSADRIEPTLAQKSPKGSGTHGISGISSNTGQPYSYVAALT